MSAIATTLVFLFADTQIKLNSFVEDINNLLNSGEVPNIFADAAERAEVIDGIRKYAREDGHKDLNAGQLYNYFIARAKSNMHIVLAFSPIGDAFRERLRKFPALINCCTINWFFRYIVLLFVLLLGVVVLFVEFIY